jgi:hypothetical protein
MKKSRSSEERINGIRSSTHPGEDSDLRREHASADSPVVHTIEAIR